MFVYLYGQPGSPCALVGEHCGSHVKVPPRHPTPLLRAGAVSAFKVPHQVVEQILGGVKGVMAAAMFQIVNKVDWNVSMAAKAKREW